MLGLLQMGQLRTTYEQQVTVPVLHTHSVVLNVEMQHCIGLTVACLIIIVIIASRS
jgi:hypothetical protein